MEFNYEKNKIYMTDTAGKTLAEVTFPQVTEDVVNIDHTFVDNSLRGKGVANELLLAVTNKLREENKKAYLTCSYAVKWFEENKEYSDLCVEKK